MSKLNNKHLTVFDGADNRDKCSFKKTNIDVICHETGEVIFKGLENKVILAGSAFTAAKHFNLKPKVYTPSYNEVLKLEHSVVEPYKEPGIRKEEQVFLFAVGTDGCGPENSQVFDVDYSKWIAPENLVPFRYQLANNDLAENMRGKYYGRKVQDNRIIYYFKAFDAEPEFKQQYTDGTPIDENVYLSHRLEEIESYVELNLSVTKEDCRDFFLATTGINDARINSISLLTAWKKEIDGHTYFQDIRPLTKLNFPNESLIDLSKGIDIIYHIYY